MIAPRDIYELADTVEAELLAQDGADLEQVEEILWYSWLFANDSSIRDVKLEGKSLTAYILISGGILALASTCDFL